MENDLSQLNQNQGGLRLHLLNLKLKMNGVLKFLATYQVYIEVNSAGDDKIIDESFLLEYKGVTTDMSQIPS